jgi:hypothetical protein
MDNDQVRDSKCFLRVVMICRILTLILVLSVKRVIKVIRSLWLLGSEGSIRLYCRSVMSISYFTI